jgi:gas vesicle protein
MRKWVKKVMIGLGVLLVIILLANFGLNIWLKTQLPNYIKNNTDYKVSYKLLEVDLMSGNILSTGISVNSKNPQNINVIGLQGTIDTLKITRFGIYDAIFNKQISSSDLLLSKLNLNIILAKPVDAKTGKKRSPFLFENIRINEGNISVFRYTKQKFLSVQDLDLYVENLQMTEESVEDKLPVVFDKYDIKGKNFFVRPNTVYALKISAIKTSNGHMSIDEFQLIPLLSFDQFKKYYPKKTKLFQFNIQKMEFTDVVLKKNKVSLANASFYNPNLLVYTTNATPVKVKKPVGFELNLEDVKLQNATVQVMKPDGEKLLYAKNLNLNINQLRFDKETREAVIPVGYKDFQLSGNDILYSNHQNFNIGSLTLNPKKGEVRNISIVPNGSSNGKTSMNLVANYIGFAINKWEFIDKKLNLDVNDVLINNVNGTIKAGEIKNNKKANLAGIQFPIVIRKVMLKNSNITYDKGNQPLIFNDLNATLNDIQLTSKPNNAGLAVNVKSYFVTTKNFAYKTQFYNMTVGLLKLNKNNIEINNFAMNPLISRAQFIKMIPVERDLYDIKANQITADGTWDLFSNNKSINASNVTIQSADANIFRSKIPNDDPKEKSLYSRMLRSIKIPMIINSLSLKNSKLVYEEDTPESVGPGKLTFGNFNMNVRNLNSAKLKGKPTKVDIKINCSFMNLAPLSVNWNFDVADQRDIFYISGKAVNLPAEGINPFIRPYLHVTATGTIQEMLFNFKGNPKGLNGSFNLRHKDLKVAILDKNNQEKKGFLTAVANLLVKSDSGKLPDDVSVEDVERDPTKSFFNMFWKGIEQGLKKTLIGINIDKAKKTVDNAKTTVKEVKKDVKGMKQSVKEIKQEVKKNSNENNKEKTTVETEKKGFLRGVFKKKEKPETE